MPPDLSEACRHFNRFPHRRRLRQLYRYRGAGIRAAPSTIDRHVTGHGHQSPFPQLHRRHLMWVGGGVHGIEIVRHNRSESESHIFAVACNLSESFPKELDRCGIPPPNRTFHEDPKGLVRRRRHPGRTFYQKSRHGMRARLCRNEFRSEVCCNVPRLFLPFACRVRLHNSSYVDIFQGSDGLVHLDPLSQLP